MDPAIVISPPPAQDLGAGPAPAVDRSRHRPAVRPPLHLVALGGLLALSLGLRLWGIKQGLPYSYNSDEATHFVSKAVGLAGGDLNPHYFLNPPAYTYLLYGVLVLWFGGGHALHAALVHDPSAVYLVARVVSAVAGTVGVWLTYVAGARLFGRWAGLLAAAALGLAFLPVFYAHLALNDSPTLAPVALSLVGVAGILRRDRSRGRDAGRNLDYVLAGLGVGLAAATKYTGGFMLVCVLAASGWDARSGDWRTAARRLALALAVALVAFLAADPYAVLDHGAFLAGLSYQAGAVGTVKLGTNPGSGWVYYLWTFTWGLGWVPSLGALAGAGMLLARRRTAEALILVAPVLGYVLYMGDQERFFGRWLMPVFPVVALLAGFAGVSVLGWFRGRVPRLATSLLGALTVLLLLGESVAADIHDDRVLSRPDTRELARAWMVRHIPPGTRVVIEPVTPADWGARWHQYPTALGLLPDGRLQPIHVDEYEAHLSPALISRYVAGGYCWVVVGSQQSGRAFAAPGGARGALAYYAALARRAVLVHRVSPYAAGSRPPVFNYDWSFDYYPGQYRLPGPVMSIYRLTAGRCASSG